MSATKVELSSLKGYYLGDQIQPFRLHLLQQMVIKGSASRSGRPGGETETVDVHGHPIDDSWHELRFVFPWRNT